LLYSPSWSFDALAEYPDVGVENVLKLFLRIGGVGKEPEAEETMAVLLLLLFVKSSLSGSLNSAGTEGEEVLCNAAFACSHLLSGN
jgi:hypothetical protein